MRRIVIIAGVALAFVLGAALALPLLVDVNRYRDLIQTKAEEAIGRKVTLGPMSLRVLPAFGIRVSEPVVEGLLRARSLTVGVRLLPLLFGGQVDVRKVILDHPEIAVTRSRDGSWNLETIGGAQAPGGTGGAAPEPDPPRAFSLAKLQITDGSIHVRDESRRSGPPLDVVLTLDLTGSARRTGTGDLESAFDGRLTGDGILLDLSGTLSRSAPPAGRLAFDLDVDSAEVEIARARDLAGSFGQPWPLPDGVLTSRSVRLSGRLGGKLGAQEPARFSLSDVRLAGAELALARDRTGRWNFEPLTKGSGLEGRPEPGGEDLPIEIRNLELSGATVALHDEATGGAGPVDLVLKDLSLAIDELAPGRPLALRLETKVTPGGGTLTVAGTIPIAFQKGRESPIDLEADLRGIEARSIGPYLKSLLGLPAGAGTLSAGAKLKGSYPRRIEATGSLAVDGLQAGGAAGPVSARAEFQLAATDGAARLEISRLAVSSGRSRLDVSGTIDNRSDGTLIDLEIPASTIDASDLHAFLVLGGVASPVEFSSSRPVRLQATVRGDIKRKERLRMSGSVEVADVTLRHPMLDKPMEKVAGRLTLRDDGFDIGGFTGVIGSSDIGGKLSVAGLDAPRVTFALTSRRADFWELMSFLREEPAGPGAPAGGAPTSTSGGEDALSRIAARGTLEIGEGSFGTLAFTGLSTTMTLDKKLVRLDPIAMKLYGGSMTGSAALDLGDPAVYSVSAAPRAIDADALLAANLQMKDTLAGALSGDLSITTWGTSRDDALTNARGSGQIRIDDGHVGAINVLKVLSRASDLLGEKSLEQVSRKLAKQGTDFSELVADLKVSGGVIASDRLRMTSADLELKDDGELDMLAGTLRVAGQIIFSEALSQAMAAEKSKAVDYFWDDQRGRVNLPVTVSGPIASPMPSIDWGAAGSRLAGRKVREKLGDKIREAGLGGLLGDRAAGEPPRARREGATDATGTSRPAAAPAAASGELSITVEEGEFTGNLLMPDLKLNGTLNGTDIATASVRVLDEKGRLVQEETLDGKIGKYYTTHERSAPASIRFRVTVDGRKLAGSRKGVRVEIRVQDTAGHSAEKLEEISR